jgi:hypothetical protein
MISLCIAPVRTTLRAGTPSSARVRAPATRNRSARDVVSPSASLGSTASSVTWAPRCRSNRPATRIPCLLGSPAATQIRARAGVSCGLGTSSRCCSPTWRGQVAIAQPHVSTIGRKQAGVDSHHCASAAAARFKQHKQLGSADNERHMVHHQMAALAAHQLFEPQRHYDASAVDFTISTEGAICRVILVGFGAKIERRHWPQMTRSYCRSWVAARNAFPGSMALVRRSSWRSAGTPSHAAA